MTDTNDKLSMTRRGMLGATATGAVFAGDRTGAQP